MGTILPEERVVGDWLGRARAGAEFTTVNHGPVTVLGPGRRNDDHGADFSDALLATRRGITVGDIEVHTLSSGWWAHRHHEDPAYNRVVLHVVHRDDAGRDAVLQNGRTVPTVVLEGSGPPLERPVLPDTARFLPCVTGQLSHQAASVVLDDLGRIRFRERVTAFHEDIEAEGADQALYAGLAAALGYRRNRDPMRRLAAFLPYRELQTFLAAGRGEAARRTAAEGLLLGTAGLLPSQRTRRAGGTAVSKTVVKLEAVWHACGGSPCLSESDWHHARVRPGNYPVRRLAALARLLVRYRQAGLVEGLLAGLAGASSPREMAALVAVPAAGFWSRNLDFGLPAVGKGTAPCGAGRAGDLVVNVLLPFAAAWYGRNGYGEGEYTALVAYQLHPVLTGNTVIEEVRRRLGLARPATALRQQGMLHLHQRYCAPGRCADCPLGDGGD